MPTPRSRVLVTITLFVVIGLGLASRKFPLPTFLAENSGDALWTGAVYLSIAFLLPRTAPLKLGLAALAISFSVELFQLVDTPWLKSLRQTLPGRLLLGQGFRYIDLPRYLTGAILATSIDYLIHRAKARSRSQP